MDAALKVLVDSEVEGLSVSNVSRVKQRWADGIRSGFRAEDAEASFDLFVSMYEDKYPKASRCLEKGCLNLMGFDGFPAKHTRHQSDRVRLISSNKRNTLSCKGLEWC